MRDVDAADPAREGEIGNVVEIAGAKETTRGGLRGK